MKQEKIRISALSYSNTYPFVLGLNQKMGEDAAVLNFEVPAMTARRFANGEVDIALVPVGALIDFDDYQIITDFCIGADGPVKTVCLYSNYKIDKLEKIYLDNESRTSFMLVQIIAAFFWKIKPEFEILKPDTILKSNEAILLIGDKTFGKSTEYNYTWDLANEWKIFTGLPFVFAVWISRKNANSEFIVELNAWLQYGLDSRSQIGKYFKLPVQETEFQEYINNFIDYNLDFQKRHAISLFLDLTKKLNG